MPTDTPVQTNAPKWKYTFAQSQPFQVLGQCNDAEGLGCLNLSRAKGDLLISFDDGQNYARVGEVLYMYGQKDLVGIIRQGTAPENWKTSNATFKGWMYWTAQGQKPDRTQFEVKREKITKGQPSLWENQYQQLTEFNPFSSYARWQELLKNLPPLRLPDRILKEKDWTTPTFDFGPFIVDGAVTGDDTQGQAGTQTPEQMQARIQDLESKENYYYRKFVDKRSECEDAEACLEAYKRWHKEDRGIVDKQRGEIQDLQRTIASLEALAKRQQEDIRVITQDRDFQVKVVQRLERQHEHDVKLSKIQAQVLRGYQLEVNDFKAANAFHEDTIFQVAAQRDELKEMVCKQAQTIGRFQLEVGVLNKMVNNRDYDLGVATFERDVANSRADAWELEARRRGFVEDGGVH